MPVVRPRAILGGRTRSAAAARVAAAVLARTAPRSPLFQALLALAPLAPVALAACGGDSSTGPSGNQFTQSPTISVTPADVTIDALEATAQLSASATDAAGANVPAGDIAWTSDETVVATVDGSGLVTSHGEGTARIVASFSGAADTALVTVEQVAASVAVTPSAAELTDIGDTVRLSAEALDATDHAVAGAGFAWSSSDTTVAAVDAAGLVTARDSGSVSVTATLAGATNPPSDASAITVMLPPEPVDPAITVTPADTTLDALEVTVQLSASATDTLGQPANAAEIAWSSDDEAVATVDASGLVTSHAEGSARIIAAYDGAADSASITVEQVVSELTVTPAQADLAEIGDTVRLSAEALDRGGSPVAGITIDWESSLTGVVTVDAAGLVTAQDTGTASVIASAEGHADTATVNVAGGAAELEAPVITSVSPALLVEGGTATITGTDFGAAPGDNTVSVDGIPATVLTASPSEVTITVPIFDCLPARQVGVALTTAGGADTAAAPLEPAQAPVGLAAGEALLLQDPADFCLQFAETAGDETYLVVVQSVSEVASSLTPVRITIDADVTGTPLVAPPVPSVAPRVPSVGGPPVYSLTPTVGFGGGVRPPEPPERWRRHRRAEARLRAAERAMLERLRGAVPRYDLRAAAAAAAIPGTVVPGDTVTVQYPDLTDLCNSFTAIEAVVRAVGDNGIWVEDVGNPAGGYQPADFQTMSDLFDDLIFDTDIEYFGNPTDLDGNSRIVVFVTKEINKEGGGLLGFVSPLDLFPSACPAANGGEFYYAKAPDPTGVHGPAYSVDAARADIPTLISHEFSHILQIGARMANFNFLDSWIAEGQATFAEEVVGHAFTGRSPGQNYGFSVAANNPPVDTYDWYVNRFNDLGFYFGFQAPTTRIQGAPEECSWLDETFQAPCGGRPLKYGVSWSFLRWISDQYGPTYPGGEPALHRDLVSAASQNGFALIETVVGEDIETLLANWAAALYLDDRVPVDPSLTFTSWNFFDIFDVHLAESAQLVPAEGAFTDQAFTGEVRAASAAYLKVSGTGRPATAIRVRGDADGVLPSIMQVHVIRME